MGVTHGPVFNNEYSMNFDGGDTYVKVADASSGPLSDIGTGDFTISIWAANDLASGYQQMLFSWTTPGLQILRYTNGYFAAYIGDPTEHLSSFTIPADGSWHHYCVTRSSGLCDMYVDGVSVITQFTETGSLSAGAPTLIGNRDSLTAPWNGNIDEVAIFDYALPPIDVIAIYNSGKPNNIGNLPNPPTVWYRMGDNGAFKDPQWLLPENSNKDNVSNYSMSFDGTDEVMSARGASNPWFPYLTGKDACTLSVWIKASVGINNMRFVEKNGVIAMIQVGTTSQIRYSLYTSAGQVYFDGNIGTLDNTWIHCAMIYNGTDFKVYENGSLLSTTPHTGTIVGNTQYFYFGDYGSGGYALDGNLDDVAMFDTEKSIGDLWDGSGKPTDLISQSGLVGYWLMGDMAYSGSTWVIPDQVGNADATSSNMEIFDRIGDAPSSTNNGLSYNMELNDRVNDTPG